MSIGQLIFETVTLLITQIESMSYVQVMLSFSQYPGFEYEPFLPSLELLSPPTATV